MKYHIEKNTVQETLVIPLYGRKMCSELYPNLYRDETALRLIDQIDYDFSLLSQKSKSLMQQFGFLEAAMRQNDLAWEVRDYLREHPNAAVVNLGCGLDDTGRSCDNGSCRIYNLDFPGVIAVRDALLPAGEREENIACDLNDTTWFRRIDASGGAVFFAARCVLLFPDGAGAGACAGHGRSVPWRQARLRRGESESSAPDAQNVDQNRRNSGCRCVFRRFRRKKGAFRLVAASACVEPGLYAGLPEPE